jgi:hypothetical protein
LKEGEKMSVGKQIRLYLIEKGISQTWVSEQARIALPKLNASLNDKRKLDVEEFSSIINVLKEDANRFLKK